jgi:hypothetical protein
MSKPILEWITQLENIWVMSLTLRESPIIQASAANLEKLTNTAAGKFFSRGDSQVADKTFTFNNENIA